MTDNNLETEEMMKKENVDHKIVIMQLHQRVGVL